MAYTKNATVDSWDTAKQLDYYKANPNEAKQEIARAQGVGGSAASSWASQLQGLSNTSNSSSSNSGTSVLRDAYNSRSNSNPWQSSNPIGTASSSPSAYVAQAGKNTSGVGVSTPATSYTGASSVIGNVNGSTDLNKSYQGLYDSVRASDPTRNQINTWGDKNGNVYDTTKMTAQQIFALSLNKDNNPNAAAILKGMGLDMNGNPTSPMPTFSFSGGGGGGGLSSDPRTSLSSVHTPSQSSTSGAMTPTYTKNPTIDAMPIDQQIAYYKANPAEAQKEIARAEGIGSAGAMSWANQLKSSLSAPGSQQSAQSWINDQTSGQGGLSNYVAMQQSKWDQAQAQGDTDMISRLNADMARVGYKLNTGTAQNNVGTGTGTGMGAGVGTGTGQQTAADLIKSMYDSNYASQSQAIKSSRDLMLAGLAGKEGQINQSTTANLNSNDVMANQRMQALKEAMANAGLSASGDNVSAQVGLGNSQQQGATDINNNKTNQLSDLLAQRNAINNNASADDLALLQQLQAQRDGLLLNQSNADRTFNYNAGQDAINNARQSKVDNWNAYVDSVGMSGYLGTGAKADWSLLGGTDGAMTLDAKTKYLQQEGIKVNNELAKIQLADYPAEQKLKMLQLQKQIAEIGKAPYQSAVDVEYDKIKLDTAKEQLNQLVNGKPTTSKPKTAEEFAKYIDSTPGVVTKDFSGKENVNKTAVETMIVTSDLSELEMYKLYQRYGLKWDGPVPAGK